MATTNITKQFKSLLPETNRFRATVLEVDEALSRVKIQWGQSQLWVSTMTILVVDEQVLVEDTMVVSKLPALPFVQIEIS